MQTDRQTDMLITVLCTLVGQSKNRKVLNFGSVMMAFVEKTVHYMLCWFYNKGRFI